MEEKKRLEQERLRCEQERQKLEKEVRAREEKEAQMREQKVRCDLITYFSFIYHLRDTYLRYHTNAHISCKIVFTR